MSDPEQDLLQGIAAREGGGMNRPARRRVPMHVFLLYIMLAAAAALCLQLTTLDPFTAIFGSAVALGAFWVGFGMLQPVGVASLLGICIILGAAGHHPSLSVALLAATGAAAAVGAHLSRRELEEDNYFFLPLLTVAGLMALLVTLGAGNGWNVVLRHAGLMIIEKSQQNEKFLRMWLDVDNNPQALSQEALDSLLHPSGPFIMASLAVFWALIMWATGRLARRRLGRMRGLRTSLFMFRIEQRYIFLLILGLVLEIFSSLGMRETFAYLAWPILGVVALAGFLEGLGIVLFLAMIRRMAGQAQLAFWISALGVVVAVLDWRLITLVGLADVWFDFRKLERLRRQIEAGTQDQKD